MEGIKIKKEFGGITPSHFEKALRTGNPRDLESSSNWNQWNDYCKKLKGEDESLSDLDYGFVYFNLSIYFVVYH